ncbi:MAG: putative baseplate assembly protein [bacterium]|nr:putative baseplate assembly protein [bacterium]
MSDLDDLLTRCNCCTGSSRVVPVDLSQRPGLSSLAYRIGTHGQFKEAMLAALAGDTPLGELGTRRDDDLTIALLDSWATVLDVLTFYQERIANESYLRTAIHERSLHELARLVGYQPRPGVAAGVPLSFTLDDGPNAPESVTLPVGTRAQSVPVGGELPQSFETVNELLARPEWNRLTPRAGRPQTLSVTTTSVWIEGVSSGLSTGDVLLLVDKGAPFPRQVTAIDKDVENERTRLTIAEAWVPAPPPSSPGISGGFGSRAVFGETAPTDGGGEEARPAGRDDLMRVAEDSGPGAVSRREMIARLRQGRYNRDQLRQALANRRRATDPEPAEVTATVPAEVAAATPVSRAARATALEYSGVFGSETALYALRVKTAPFGHNAPAYPSLPAEWRVTGFYPQSWEGIGIAGKAFGGLGTVQELRLEREFPEVTADSWVVIRDSGSHHIYRVEGVSAKTVVDFGLSGRVTSCELTHPSGAAFTFYDYQGLASYYDLRGSDIYAGSEELTLADEPIETIDQGTTQLELEEVVFDLEAGRTLILCGERHDLPGVIEQEELTLEQVNNDGDYSELQFTPPLEHTYRRDSVEIHANVVTATHGESHGEVLGSGDASQAFQTFALRQAPLTHVSAPVPSGGESTLDLRVGGVLWQEASGFYSLGPDDLTYVLERDHDGETRVIFGDGIKGARLPTGSENVSASYRVGIGSGGLVGADSISLLATRHLGVRGVVNPLASSGAEDAEDREQLRRNAPLTVLTFDRVVALQDFEDFARAFSGVGKARASWVWDGSRRVVHLTVAGSGGGALSQAVRENLLKALDETSAPFQQVRVDDHELLLFDIDASVRLETGYRGEAVLPAVKAALAEAFSFSARDFARRVATSEVLATIQGVEGVAAVTHLDELEYATSSNFNQPDEIGLPALGARFDSGTVLPAQLLLVMEEEIQIQEASR